MVLLERIGMAVAVRSNSKPSRSIKSSKLKSLIKQLQSRLTLLKKRRESMARLARADIALLLRDQQLDKALYRVEQLYRDQALLSAYDDIDQFCGCIAASMPQIRRMGDVESLPIDVLEAASSLVFAASRCGELPELNAVRHLLKRRFGNRVEAGSVELQDGSFVNPKMKQNVCGKYVPDDEKLNLMKEMAEENSLPEEWTSSIDKSLNEESRNLSSKPSPSHVHPKLPEYEDVVAKLTGLKKKIL